MNSVLNALQSLIGDQVNPDGTGTAPEHPEAHSQQTRSNPFGCHEMDLKGELGQIFLNDVRNKMHVDAMGAAIGNGINPNAVIRQQPTPEPSRETDHRLKEKETHKETGVLKGGILALAGVALPVAAMFGAGVFDKPAVIPPPETPIVKPIVKTVPGKTVRERVKIESKVRPPAN